MLYIMRRLNYILLVLSAIILVSCQDDYGDIDNDLTDALKLESQDGTIEYFVQPESDDLNSIPQDPKNILSTEKVKLGQLLFHETGLAENPKDMVSTGQYSCASCHQSKAGFQAGNAQGIGEGGIGFGHHGESRTMYDQYAEDSCDVQPIKSPTVLNSAYQTNMLWNGQFGSTHVNVGTEDAWTEGTPKAINNLGFQGVETQAIAGLDVHRLMVNEELITKLGYKALFDDAFSDIAQADRYTKVTAGLAIAAYERTLMTTDAPFQRWLKGDYAAMNVFAKKGALVFFGKGECSTCHTGPALNSMEFHAYGFNDLNDSPEAILRRNSMASENLGRGGFTGIEKDNYKFKVPQLYNLAYLDFFGHGASMSTLRKVVEYKNTGIKENSNVPDKSLSPHFRALDLNNDELNTLIYFIEKALYDPSVDRYVPSGLPSGNCFPNADEVSMRDIGCE